MDDPLGNFFNILKDYSVLNYLEKKSNVKLQWQKIDNLWIIHTFISFYVY